MSLPAPYDEPDKAAELARSVGLELPSTMGPGFNDLFALPVGDSLPEILARTERGCQSARALGATAILQIPGFVQIAWDPKSPVIPYDVAWDRALTIYRALAPVAEKHGICLCVENVWNRFLLSPLEMRQFVDAIGSPAVRVYFDVGNQLLNGFPEQWLASADVERVLDDPPLSRDALDGVDGVATTCASAILKREGRAWHPPFDATVVARLKAEGAILPGFASW